MDEVDPVESYAAVSELTANYEAITPSLYAWARCRIPAAFRGSIDAEDVIQETWVRVIPRAEEYVRSLGSFRQWVFGFARLVLAELGRAQASRDARFVADPRVSKLTARITTASRRAARNEGVALLLRQVHLLDDQDRQLLYLRGFEGMNHDDVAQHLNTSPGAVRKRWQRLRERLQDSGVPADLLEVS